MSTVPRATKSKTRRLAVLTEGGLDAFRNKTAIALLRFCPEDVVCVIDSHHVGMDLDQLAGVGKGIPIVGTAIDAVKLGVDYLVIGVATPGGFLPAEMRPIVYDAIRNRVGIISGLHESLGGDPNLASLAARHAVDLINLRKVSEDEHSISTGLARSTKAFRVLTVGTDCNIGKTTTTLMLDRYLRRQQVRSQFVATGQDGILVQGRGTCIDRVISDFASGAVESLLLREAKGADVLMIEGQDAILSPPFSAVAISLLHGSCPDAMVLCHVPSRHFHRHTDVPIPSLARYRDIYESLLAPMHPGKVVAISLNTQGMSDADSARILAQASAETGLPAVDPVREGDAACQRICEILIATAKKNGRPFPLGKFKVGRSAKSAKK